MNDIDVKKYKNCYSIVAQTNTIINQQQDIL